MRYLAFSICFLFSAAVGVIIDFKTNASDSVPFIAVSQPIQLVHVDSQIQVQTEEYLTWKEGTVEYNGFKINNSKKGLTISKKDRRLLFIANEQLDKRLQGRFGLKTLLGGSEKQLIYETRTGGNHCCIYDSIIDVSGHEPRVLFKSSDFDVFGVPSAEDPLGLFDADGDGVVEITQTSTYFIPDGVMVSNPVISIGFRFNKKLNTYVPTGKFVPGQAEWVADMKRTIEKANTRIENDNQPESLIGYDSLLMNVALNYAAIGELKIGFDYLKNNTFAYEFKDNKFHYDSKNSVGWALELQSKVRKHSHSVKAYRLISKL